MSDQNGMADTIIEEARSRVINGKSTQNDRLILVMDALTNRSIAAATNKKEFKIKLFGREWSANEMVFAFGAVMAAEGAAGVAAIAAFGG